MVSNKMNCKDTKFLWNRNFFLHFNPFLLSLHPLMKSPIVAYLMPFLLGILLQEYFPTVSLWCPILLTLLSSAAALVAIRRQIPHPFPLAFISLSILSLAFAISIVRQPDFRNDHYTHFLHDDSPQWITVQLRNIPEVSPRSVKVEADLLSIQDSAASQPVTGRVMLFFRPTPRSQSLAQGDRLLLHTTLTLPSTSSNPHQFDYRRHLRHRGILRQTYLTDPSFRLLTHSDNGLRLWSLRLRSRLMQVIRSSHLTPKQQSISEALILGWRADIDPSTQQQFRDAGITHLLCVSGLHVGIISGLVGHLFFFLGNGPRVKRLRGLIQLLAIWFFVLISGMAPSTLRAAWMFTFVVIGQMFFARPPTFNALASSALLLLLFRPGLLFDVGFQLSYTAVVAILLFHRPLFSLIPLPNKDDIAYKPLLPKVMLTILRWLWSWTCLSTVAQLSTLPITLYYFHQFPLYFLIANLTIVPFSALLLASILLLLLFSIWPLAFSFFAHLVSLQITYIDTLTSWVSSLPHALLDNLYFDLPMLILSILTICLLGRSLIIRKPRPIPLALSALILLSAHYAATSRHIAHQRQWVIYSAGTHLAAEFLSGHQSLLLADTLIAAQPSIIDFQRHNHLTMSMIQSTTTLTLHDQYSSPDLFLSHHILQFGDTRMLWVDHDFCRGWNHLQRRQDQLTLPHLSQHLNYVILTSNPFITIPQLQLFFDFDTLILTPANSPRLRQQWITQCDTLHLPLIDIAQQGALQRKF